MNYRAVIIMAIAALSLTSTVLAATVPGQGTWKTNLQARDLNGDQKVDAFHDTELNVTWLRDANMIGWRDWDSARNWADALVIGHFNDWRLPGLLDTGAPGCNFAYGGTDCGFNVQTKDNEIVYSEIAHLWYVTLGNIGYCNTDGSCNGSDDPISTGHFESLVPPASDMPRFWIGTEYPDPAHAWYFDTGGGFQGFDARDWGAYALALHPGDIGVAVPIPEPQSYIMLMLGLIFMALWQSIERKSRHNSDSIRPKKRTPIFVFRSITPH